MSDDGIDNDGNTENDSTTTSLTIDKRIEATKTYRVADNGDGENGTGDVVTFTITVQNTGQIALSGITLVDLLTDCTGTLTLTMASGPTWNSNSAGSAQGSLNPGEIGTYTATYTIGNAEIGSGCILNTVSVTANSPGNTGDVTDVSDDGNDADGNLVDDETRIDFTVDPAVEELKTGLLVDNGDNLPGVGDTAVFTIVVTNKGNTALTSITLTETFQRGNGTSISLDAGPTFNSSTGGSAAGSLQTGESATYTASYTVDATDVATTKVQNQVTVSAQTLDGSITRTDVSDDGDDLDGNTQNDVTEVRLISTPF